MQTKSVYSTAEILGVLMQELGDELGDGSKIEHMDVTNDVTNGIKTIQMTIKE